MLRRKILKHRRRGDISTSFHARNAAPVKVHRRLAINSRYSKAPSELYDKAGSHLSLHFKATWLGLLGGWG